jgi:hypothetical protein
MTAVRAIGRLDSIPVTGMKFSKPGGHKCHHIPGGGLRGGETEKVSSRGHALWVEIGQFFNH